MSAEKFFQCENGSFLSGFGGLFAAELVFRVLFTFALWCA